MRQPHRNQSTACRDISGGKAQESPPIDGAANATRRRRRMETNGAAASAAGVRIAMAIALAGVLSGAGIPSSDGEIVPSADRVPLTVDRVNPAGPTADGLGNLTNVLRRLRDKLKQAEEEVNGSEGLSEHRALLDLEALLAAAEADIDLILDGSRSPSLSPVDAGAADPSVDPTTLAEYAQVCLLLAQDALDEVLIGPGDDELIGTRLKTIKQLLPSYRWLAGIQASRLSSEDDCSGTVASVNRTLASVDTPVPRISLSSRGAAHSLTTIVRRRLPRASGRPLAHSLAGPIPLSSLRLEGITESPAATS